MITSVLLNFGSVLVSTGIKMIFCARLCEWHSKNIQLFNW